MPSADEDGGIFDNGPDADEFEKISWPQRNLYKGADAFRVSDVCSR